MTNNSSCPHCGDNYSDREEYATHLANNHTRDEVSSIDEKLVDNKVGGFSDDGIDRKIPISESGLVLGGLALFCLVVFGGVLYIAIGGGGGGANVEGVEHMPGQKGSAHDHGTISFTIEGEELNLDDTDFTYQDSLFHMHDEQQNPNLFHLHATGVTVEHGVHTLGMEIDRHTFTTLDGTTYDDRNENERVDVLVNGDTVNPVEYRIQQDDNVEIIVESTEE